MIRIKRVGILSLGKVFKEPLEGGDLGAGLTAVRTRQLREEWRKAHSWQREWCLPSPGGRRKLGGFQKPRNQYG